MAMDPERPVEKLLREYAERRRQQAASLRDLHPVNRRLLQTEAAARFAPRRSSNTLLELLRFRGKLAWGLGFCVLALVAGGLLYVQQWRPTAGRELQLAKKESGGEGRARPLQQQTFVPPASSPMTLAGTPAPGAGRGTTAGKPLNEPLPTAKNEYISLATRNPAPAAAAPLNQPVPESPVPVQESLPLQASPPVTLTGAPALEAARADLAASSAKAASGDLREQAQGTPLRYGLAPTSALDRAPAARATLDANPSLDAPSASESGPLTFTRVSTGSAGAVAASPNSQTVFRFRSASQANPAALRASATAGVGDSPSLLRSFTVQQNGSELQIREPDGSLYTGYLDLGPTKEKAQSALSVLLQGRTNAAAFRVSGTNLTLSKQVVFTGRLSLTPARKVSGQALIDGATQPVAVEATGP